LIQIADFSGKRFSKAVLVLFALALALPILSVTTYPVHAQGTFDVYVSAYDLTNATAATVDIQIFTVSQGNTPLTISGLDDYQSYAFTADATDNFGHSFIRWEVNGYYYLDTTLYVSYAFAYANIVAVYEGSAIPPPGTGNGNYTIRGLYSESSGVLIGNVTVTAYYDTPRAPEVFTVYSTYGYYNYSTSDVPEHFHFELGASDREYWPEPDEISGTINVFNDTLASYTVNFMDQVGVLNSNPYITFKEYVNGTLSTVEKRVVDSQKSIEASLVDGRKYALYIEGVDGSYSYGDLLMTGSLAVQLVIRGVDFPKETLLLQKYVHVYVTRNFGTGALDGVLTVNYEDTKLETLSVVIHVNYLNGTNVLSTTYLSNQSFSFSYSALDSESYQVNVTASTSEFGTINYKQVLVKEGGVSSPWSLSFMGNIAGLESAYFIPALLIIFVAGCFSELTSEVAAVLTCIVAIILAWMGWIPIGSGALVAALAFAVMGGIVTARRRMIFS
jgi:hypothetical protein